MVGWRPYELGVTAWHTDPREVRYTLRTRFFFTRLTKFAGPTREQCMHRDAVPACDAGDVMTDGFNSSCNLVSWNEGKSAWVGAEFTVNDL